MKVNPRNYPSFYKIYLGETCYRERIHIPPAFVKAHKEEMDELFWVVKTEAGKSWDMQIDRQGTDYFFRKGDWDKLAKHYDLCFGDILHFFLVGNSEFEVMIFSQTTCCQIQQSECTDTEIEYSGYGNKKSKRSGDEAIVKEEEIFENESGRLVKGVQKNRPYNTSVYLTAKQPYFTTIVKKSHQTSMSVPVDFARHTGMIDKKSIELMSEEKGKSEKVQIAVLDNSRRVHMVKGWKSFKNANSIKSGDKCSFKLVNPGCGKKECVCFLRNSADKNLIKSIAGKLIESWHILVLPFFVGLFVCCILVG